MGFFSSLSHFSFDVGIMSWDVLLTLSNFVRRKHPIGDVTPEGHPGYGGHWPEFRPPQETDSRCSCPAFNAMANHGIISRSGHGISFVELNDHLRATYNFSPSFCSFALHFLARMLKKDYNKDTFDLKEIDLHNGIEHDASLLRLDSAFQPDQSIKHIPFIEELLATATGKDKNGNHIITTKDISRLLGKRRAVSRAVNKDFSLKLFHKIFGSAKYDVTLFISKHTSKRSVSASTLVTIFGGRVDDLRSFLLDERIPEGWESRIRQPYGTTIINFNKTTLATEFGVHEKYWAQVAREAAESHGTTPSLG
ncbi:Chloroperoxidase [Suillus clintonianus]|uniref:Chloroperoxidase n=1 Tax=Suillus clintonianus TaxID=1904413 RepID=UPI001B8843AB|nr:Chloroperoxidase [Suillus clintonianus]KAG2140651.1 Chloroperoxidase [Suillus clintonianus]